MYAQSVSELIGNGSIFLSPHQSTNARASACAQLLNNSGYRRHSERLPDLEKRARLLSAEYREIQKSRPIDVVPVSED